MFAAFGALAARAGLKLWLALAIAGAVLAALLGARRAGRMAARVEALDQVARAAQARARIETKTGGLADDDLDDLLRPPPRRGR
jgi:hypothetical protein